MSVQFPSGCTIITLNMTGDIACLVTSSDEGGSSDHPNLLLTPRLQMPHHRPGLAPAFSRQRAVCLLPAAALHRRPAADDPVRGRPDARHTSDYSAAG